MEKELSARLGCRCCWHRWCRFVGQLRARRRAAFQFDRIDTLSDRKRHCVVLCVSWCIKWQPWRMRMNSPANASWPSRAGWPSFELAPLSWPGAMLMADALPVAGEQEECAAGGGCWRDAWYACLMRAIAERVLERASECVVQGADLATWRAGRNLVVAVGVRVRERDRALAS